MDPERDFYVPGREPIAVPPEAPLKSRVYSVAAKFFYGISRWFEIHAFAGLFTNSILSNYQSDSLFAKQVKKALSVEEIREAVIRGATAPRRTPEEQRSILDAHTTPVASEERTWTGPYLSSESEEAED